MTRIVVVANTKGGTCKSTTVANLAAASAIHGFKTLLLDLDPQGSSTILSGVDRDDIDESQTSSQLFKENPALPSSLARATAHGFDVAPAGGGLVDAPRWISSLNFGVHHLYDLIREDEALSRYDFVFVDTAGNRDVLLNAALLAATDLIVPLTPSVLSTTELQGLNEIIEATQKHQRRIHAQPLNMLGIAIVRAKERTRTVQDLRTELAAVSDEGIIRMINTVIPDSDIIEKAARARVPVVNFRTGSNVGQRYMELFLELFGNLPARSKSA
jgi:chromosome partitioning protein